MDGMRQLVLRCFARDLSAHRSGYGTAGGATDHALGRIRCRTTRRGIFISAVESQYPLRRGFPANTLSLHLFLDAAALAPVWRSPYGLPRSGPNSFFRLYQLWVLSLP